ncbi:uncharacterized protein UBRO2_04897 [Ustilago bromivora]|uniref:Uncharacterized protein n=1 Tax=Ustilago bromivora TaxID=307758 RepID=A0A8H8QQR7_9BASI|nr:uncharacterized protein UBRO2_04897 [Ustilago bromivora]
MTTSTDDSLDISAQLFWQSTTPTSSTTQTESMPALSQSGSTSAPDIHNSCPTQASRSATGKKNFTWSGANVLHLVTTLYNSESYQHALLPSRESAESASVKPNHIKAKLRWLQEAYYREKKKLSLTGAALITTPSLDFTSDDKADMPSYGSADIPIDLSGSEPYDHGTHSHGLPPILDLMDPTNPPAAVASTSGASTSGASTSGASIAGAGDDDVFTTPSPLQAQPSFSTAGGLDVFDSTSSHSSAQLSPSTKCKRAMVRYSDKQVLLNDIVHTLELSIPAEIEQNTDRVQHSCSTDIDDLDDDALVILPHLLQIVELVVGQPGSIQDSKVWASGSKILKKPHLYLDEGYHGNIYCVEDCITAAQTIHACIVAHTFVSQYDCPADIAFFSQW